MSKITLAGPADLLTILPFHLGFHPTRSAVVVCFHGTRLGLVARFDLVPAPLAVSVAAGGLPTLLRDRPSSVCLVGFEDDEGESDPLIEALRVGLEQERVVVRHRLVVRDGRWFTAGYDCCPGVGRPLPEPADVPAVAGYVAMGQSVLADREALVDLVRPLCESDPRHARAEAAVDRWQARYTVAVALDRLGGRGLVPGGAAPAAQRRADRGPADEQGCADGALDDPALDACPRDERLVDDTTLGDAPLDHGADADTTLGDRTVGDVALDDVAVDDAALDGEAREDPAGEDPAGEDKASEDLAGEDRLDAAHVDGDERRDTGPAPCAQDGMGLDGHVRPGSGVAPEHDRARSPSLLMQTHSLAAWGAVLRGETHGEAVVDQVPALVGPLRDLVFRDALIAWLCPGTIPLSDFPPALVGVLRAYVGPDLRAGKSARSGARTDQRKGRRTAGRRGRGTSAASDEWHEWEEAEAAHRLQARLETVCRAAPPAHAAPLLSVVASYAWWRGDGARAGAAADTALELEPDHRLAWLIRRSLDLGLAGGAVRSGTSGSVSSTASDSWNGSSSA